MKKITFLLFTVLLFSCSNESIIEENSIQKLETIENSEIDSNLRNGIPNDGQFQENFGNLNRPNNFEITGSKSGEQFNCLDLYDPCTNNSIIVTNPFTTNLDDFGGYNYGSCFCPGSSNPNDYFGTLLRVQLIREFGRHTNNLTCGLKGSECPQDYAYVGGCFEGIYVNETFGVPDDGDGVYTPTETNYMYREIICRILDQYDTNSSEYLVIDECIVQWCLCGSSKRVITLSFGIYREN